ncbi:hypothetical protein QTP88_016796 [Uroleucon formosanum]
MLSANEIMQLVFDDLRSNRPKPLKSCYFHCLPVHCKRFISLPNMAELTNSVVEWKSTTETMLPVVDDLRENLPNPSESCDLHSLLEPRRCVSLPNLALRTISTSEISETGLKSTPNVMFSAVDDLRENVKKPSENCYVQCLPAQKRSLSLPDVALHANPGGDASEVGVSSVTSAELLVSNDSPCAETCMPCMVKSMPPASTSEDIGIETPLFVSSSSALVLKVEVGEGLMIDGWPTVKNDDALGRVYTIHPHNTECYYLRMLLHEIRGPTSFSHLKTINGILHNTFQSACNVLGLLEDDNHWNNTLNEASLSDLPTKLRELFTVMLVFCQLSDPLTLWDTHKNNLSEDSIRQMDRYLQGDADQKDEAHNKCLIQIEDAVLAVGGQSISNYGLPQPTRTENNFENIVYQREINYDLNTMAKVVVSNEGLLTNEQYNVYSRIMHSIKSDTGKMFFSNAPAGTGKTFLINLLLTKVRNNRSIALAVASSDIAATLLEGGGWPTQHSNFLSISLT